MLSGQLPFHGESSAEILAQRITGHVRDIRETGIQVPPYVWGVISRCLERSPARRYQTARELVADLDRKQAPPPRARMPRRGLALVVALVAAGAAWSAFRRVSGLPLLPPRSLPAPTTAALPPSPGTSWPCCL
jgi:serine/threonine-protein kinase